MHINTTKTKELVFHRPHNSKLDMPCALNAIVQEHVAKLFIRSSYYIHGPRIDEIDFCRFRCVINDGLYTLL